MQTVVVGTSTLMVPKRLLSSEIECPYLLTQISHFFFGELAGGGRLSGTDPDRFVGPPLAVSLLTLDFPVSTERPVDPDRLPPAPDDLPLCLLIEPPRPRVLWTTTEKPYTPLQQIGLDILTYSLGDVVMNRAGFSGGSNC